MNRNLKGRLDRLESAQPTDSGNSLPPKFWEALCGAVPEEQLDPETRQLVESLYVDRRNAPDPIEERLAAEENGLS